VSIPAFEIENISPLSYPDMWKADVILRRPETINEVEVAQVAKITVRFEHPDANDMAGIVGAAAAKALESLETYKGILMGKDGAELLSQWRKDSQVSFEFNPGDIEPEELDDAD